MNQSPYWHLLATCSTATAGARRARVLSIMVLTPGMKVARRYRRPTAVRTATMMYLEMEGGRGE